jgi:hypothetical protein
VVAGRGAAEAAQQPRVDEPAAGLGVPPTAGPPDHQRQRGQVPDHPGQHDQHAVTGAGGGAPGQHPDLDQAGHQVAFQLQ